MENIKEIEYLVRPARIGLARFVPVVGENDLSVGDTVIFPFPNGTDRNTNLPILYTVRRVESKGLVVFVEETKATFNGFYLLKRI